MRFFDMNFPEQGFVPSKDFDSQACESTPGFFDSGISEQPPPPQKMRKFITNYEGRFFISS